MTDTSTTLSPSQEPATAVTAGNVDLTTCDREQIHIPGSIQPHGVLLVINESDLTLLQVSSNAGRLLGIEPAQLIGHPLSDLMHPSEFRYWEQQMLLKRLEANPLYLVPTRLKCAPNYFEGSVHRHDGVLLLQLENYSPDESERSLDRYASARCMLTELQRTGTMAEFLAMAAQFVREQTDYDRVVVYRFLEDGSGEVVGESKQEKLPSWLGLRYPASDIPRQARELYLRSWIRIIADVNAAAAPMTPALNPLTGQPLDMSYCVLRSVSPIHIQYLRNIGAQASMSISLIKGDRLWGLIACHHGTAKNVSHAARIACEFLAHSVSLQVGGKEETEHQEYFAGLRQSVSQIVEAMAKDGSSFYQELHHLQNLSGCFRSGGSCAVVDGESILMGETPAAEQIKLMLPAIAELCLRDGVYVTDKLPEVYAAAAGFRETASGLLAIRIPDTHLQWLLWFRPEVLHTVKWAGNPNKPVEVDEESGQVRLSPRNSFELWREEHHGASEPWWAGEITVAAELRRAVVEVVLRQAEQLQQLNRDLVRSNAELESFAYVASHDLKEPLRGIHNYSHILMRSLAPKLDAAEAERLQMVLRLS